MINWREEKNYFLSAVMFFTRFPVPKSTPYSEEILHQSRKYFPFVGVLIGILAALVTYSTQLVLPLSVAIILSVVASVLATGAFHEDGFADCCDGFGGGWEKQQVLTIMKDSRVGTYAVVGLILLLSLKAFSLIELGTLSIELLLVCYINGHALSRLGASLCVEQLDYVQDIDASKIKPITKQRLSTQNMLFSALLVAPSFILLLSLSLKLVLCLIPMIIVFVMGNRYFKKRIGGYTGDCLGAMQQVLEVVFYLSILALMATT